MKGPVLRVEGRKNGAPREDCGIPEEGHRAVSVISTCKAQHKAQGRRETPCGGFVVPCESVLL